MSDEADTMVERLLSPDYTQQRYQQWLAEQEWHAAQREAVALARHQGPFPPTYPAPGLPYLAMPAPPPPVYRPGEFTEFQDRIDAMDARIKKERTLIIVQLVLLVAWVILQAVSIAQRSGRFG